jgi:hypothetical protein
MPGCLGCPTSNSTTISEDLGYYSEWADDHGIVDPLNDSNHTVFRKWFSWKLMYGTNSGGNLPERIRDHIGLSCAPCPYDENCDDIRAEHMLGSVPVVQTNHGNYYMKIEQRGSNWGFACTYSGCPYLLDTGNNYFYV